MFLHEDQFFPGYVLLVLRRHVTELYDLPAPERATLMEEVSRVAQALARVFRPVKMNYELLGNLVPHIHWHLVPRLATDPGLRCAHLDGRAPGRPPWRRPLARERIEDDTPGPRLTAWTQPTRRCMRKRTALTGGSSAGARSSSPRWPAGCPREARAWPSSAAAAAACWRRSGASAPRWASRRIPCSASRARERGLDVRAGALPDAIPLEHASGWDAVCLFDVLEHVDDEAGALAAVPAAPRARGAASS